ncbi:hypothetical protein [Maritalea porphyrae]|jgi:hypothetical protein|uniref:hypothetical protein n=1 Tax=Maritalea porphyrae TaxID=880732 RepID=UPI0022B0491D|nr:hypothetical protein [Maritalea porphyrae]MCZ4271576.1 hypothetical protein [Maritalea porphyrae]
MLSPNMISRIAGILAKLVLFAAIVLPLAVLSLVLFLSSIHLEIHGANEISLSGDQITPLVRVILFVFSAGYFALLVAGLLSIRQTLIEAEHQRWLSFESVRGFRRFAIANLAIALYEIFFGALAFALIDLQNGDSSFSVQFGMTAELVSALFTGLVILIAAHIFTVGQAAYEENRSFI